jgi:hypothetical protein
MKIKMKYYQGKFNPKNPHKYKGDPTNIIYRSSWELKVMIKFDNEPNIIWWKSEEIAIPYRSPIDGKIHRYFPDFIVQVKNKDGKLEILMIEIKPFKQTQEPKKQKTPSKKYLKEVFTWGINSAKWSAAKEYCKDRGYKFCIFTEKELDIKH